MDKKFFGKTKSGEDVYLYTLKNGNGMEAHITNYGAILVKLLVPDKNGNLADVVLGYDKLEDYFVNSSFFGATVGPNANRIKDAKFEIDGTTYKLAVNDGLNNLHSDFEAGVHKKVWSVTEDNNSIILETFLKEGELGFPGNKKITVTYTLTSENAIEIHYYATTDKRTLFNMTNHSYFNLDGHSSGDIHSHILTIIGSNYTPVVAGAIPTGEILTVVGTPFDFTIPKRVGQAINEQDEQLLLVGGYDHNWVVDGWDGEVQKIATVENAEASRIMDVYTDLPGVQFYAGNFIGKGPGKDNAQYGPRMGLCLETQYYPNAANESDFPQPFTSPEKPYDTTTVYKFR